MIPGDVQTEPVEMAFEDFVVHEVDEDGYSWPQLDLPDELPFDEAVCSTPECGEPIGAHYWEGEDSYGNTVGGAKLHETWRLPDGTYVCGDCVPQPA